MRHYDAHSFRPRKSDQHEPKIAVHIWNDGTRWQFAANRFDSRAWQLEEEKRLRFQTTKPGEITRLIPLTTFHDLVLCIGCDETQEALQNLYTSGELI